MRRAFLVALLALVPLPAFAANTVYTGSLVVPTTGSITQSSGGSGCVIATSGVYAIGNCPAGTAAFTAGTNITITGSNPYMVNCPNCFQTTGGTISGATTVSGSMTFSALPTSSVGITNSSTTVPVTSGVSGSYSKGFALGTGAGTYSYLGTTASTLATCSIAGSAFALTVGTTLTSVTDASGNYCTIGTIYYTSARFTKQNIRAGGFDGLQVVRAVNADLAWEYQAKYGDPHQTRYGPMADDLPSYISGPKHERIDLEAVVWTEWDAIQRLDSEVQDMRVAGLGLTIWCLVLTFIVVRRGKVG